MTRSLQFALYRPIHRSLTLSVSCSTSMVGECQEDAHSKKWRCSQAWRKTRAKSLNSVSWSRSLPKVLVYLTHSRSQMQVYSSHWWVRMQVRTSRIFSTTNVIVAKTAQSLLSSSKLSAWSILEKSRLLRITWTTLMMMELTLTKRQFAKEMQRLRISRQRQPLVLWKAKLWIEKRVILVRPLLNTRSSINSLLTALR